MTLPKMIAGVSAWVWDTYGKAIFDSALIKAKQKWKQFNWADASRKYRERIIDMFSTTTAWGMTEPFKVDELFVDVFISPELTSSRFFDLRAIQQNHASIESFSYRLEPEKRKSALRAVTEENYLFLWGKPGSGKTTFLKHVALLAAKGKIDFVPIFVSLKDALSENADLLSLIVKQFQICAFPEAKPFIEKILMDGKAILLLDGLDETSEGTGLRSEVATKLEEFVNRYPLCKYLITCRIGATDYFFARFTQVEIADFQDQQIENFARRWFAKAPQKGTEFISALHGQENSLLDLARNPLLLSLLCFVYDEKGEFAQSRTGIYNDVFELFLREWDLMRNIKRDEIKIKFAGRRENTDPGYGLTVDGKYYVLSSIAFDTFKRSEIVFSQEYLEEMFLTLCQKLMRRRLNSNAGELSIDIEAGAAIKALEAQHGILIEIARRTYAFAHLNFQEYLSARFIVKNDPDELWRGKLFNSYWREVIVFSSGLGVRISERGLFSGLIEFIITNEDPKPVAKWLLLALNSYLPMDSMEIILNIVLADRYYMKQIRKTFYSLQGMIPGLETDSLKRNHPALVWAFDEEIASRRDELERLLGISNLDDFAFKSGVLLSDPPWAFSGESPEELLASYESMMSIFEQSDAFELICWNSTEIYSLIGHIYYLISLLRDCDTERGDRNSRGNYVRL